MCSPSVLECPRHTYGTLGRSCASLACPYARTRLPLLGWGGLRLSLAAQGGGMTKNLKKHEKSRNFVIFHVFLECFCGVSGVLPARLRHSRVPLCAPIREHTRLDLRYSDNYLVLSKQ